VTTLSLLLACMSRGTGECRGAVSTRNFMKEPRAAGYVLAVLFLEEVMIDPQDEGRPKPIDFEAALAPAKRRKGKGRPKKIKDMTPEEAAQQREDWRIRKENQREREAYEREEQIKANTFDNPHDYWEAQRRTLPAEKLAALLERQEAVFDQMYWMESWVNGTYNASPEDTLCYVGLEEGIADLEGDVAQHGLCMIEVTLIDKFWSDTEKDFFQRVVANGGATATFIDYGIVTAVPEHRYAAFAQKFMQKPTTITPYASTLSCLCGATTSVNAETACAYAARQYRCQRCLDKEANSRAAVVKTLAADRQLPENTFRDNWGRIKL
jgi:hypothetical protein